MLSFLSVAFVLCICIIKINAIYHTVHDLLYLKCVDVIHATVPLEKGSSNGPKAENSRPAKKKNGQLQKLSNSAP